MRRPQRSSIGIAVAAGALLAAGCSSSSTPSTFGNGGGSEGGVTDATSSESGSFGGGGSGNFMCGANMCTRYDWCLFIVSDAGAEMSATCVPYGAGTCEACNCLEQMASTGQCAGDSVTCTPMPPFTITCIPGGGSSGGPADSGASD